MIAAIHQPHYLPWLRYLHKIQQCDVFVVLDDVQYEKNGFQNRNRIKTPEGWSYLTVPIRRPTQRPIREIEVDEASGWREKHRRALELNYGRAPHFPALWARLRPTYERAWSSLAELNGAMLQIYLDELGIRARVEWSSRLAVPGEATERIAGICEAVGADTYLSGAYAVQAYLDPEVLRRRGIRLAFQEWSAPVYPQLFPRPGFQPDLAIVDLLFNTGPEAASILAGAGAVRPAE